MRKKLGLRTDEAGDAELIRALLDWMQKSRADFTNTFRDLSSEEPPAGDRYRDPDFQAWYSRWQERLGRDGQPDAAAYAAMRAVNPAVIPRNHRVEEALSAAEDHDDLSVLHQLLAALASPYEAAADLAPVSRPARRRLRLSDVLRDVGEMTVEHPRGPGSASQILPSRFPIPSLPFRSLDRAGLSGRFPRAGPGACTLLSGGSGMTIYDAAMAIVVVLGMVRGPVFGEVSPSNT